MKLTIRLSLVCLFFITCTFSCTKKELPSTGAQSAREVLIASQWKKSEYRENGVVTPFFASCEMDDILSFSTNGNYSFNWGANQCSSPGATTDFFVIDADNKTMRWGLYGAGEISFNSTNTSFTFKRTGAITFEYIFVKN